MADEDLFATLMRFHQEVTRPDMDRLITDRIDALRVDLRNEMLGGFDAIYKRFDRVEAELVATRGAISRLEEQMVSLEHRFAAIEEKLDRLALKSELLELEERVDEMQQRIDQLKSMLNEH